MRILYFGDPAGGLALLERGLTPVGVVHGRAGGKGRHRFVAQIRSLPRWQLPDLEDPRIIHELARLQPDLLVAAVYPQRIPQSVLNLAPGINVHPSDLPRWRGPDPCSWTIRAGDPMPAVTVHWLTAGFDEGDIIHRWAVPVGLRDTAGRLAARLEALGAEKVADTAVTIASGVPIESVAQSGDVTWAPMVEAEDWEIDWQLTADEIDRLVRAAMPEPGAFTGIGNELLVILNARAVETGVFAALEPGTPYVKDHRLHIRCGIGALRLDRVRLGRRPLWGRELARLFI